jgi:hypothetical protein
MDENSKIDVVQPRVGGRFAEKWPPELRARIIEMRKAGEKLEYIALVTGITLSAVTKIANRAGLGTRLGGSPRRCMSA